MRFDTQNSNKNPPSGIGFSFLIITVFLIALTLVSVLVMATGYLVARRAIDHDIARFAKSSEAISNLVLQSRLQDIQRLLDLTALDENMRTAIQSQDSEAIADWLSAVYYAQEEGRFDILFVQSATSKRIVDVSTKAYDTQKIRQAAVSNDTLDLTNQIFITGDAEQPLYSIVTRRDIIAPQTGKLLGTVYGGVVLNDNISFIRDILTSTGSSAAGLYHGSHLIVSFPSSSQELLSKGNHPHAGVIDDNTDYALLDAGLALPDGEEHRLHIVNARSLEAVAKLEHNYQMALYFLAGFILIIAGVAAWGLKRVSTKAIATLSSYASRVARREDAATFSSSAIREFNEIGATLEHFVFALQESEQQQRDLLNHTTSVIYMKDPDGRYQFINRTYEELFHISVDEIRGRTDYDLLPAENAEVFHANDLKALESGMPFEIEETVLLDDGEHTYISVKFPLKNAQGDVHTICGISTDITARKVAEQELQLALVDAEQANRAKSEFLATMSHEFRTPLNAILGFSEMMKAQYFGPLGSDNYREYMGHIHGSGEHMLALVNDVLDIAAIEAGKRELEKEEIAIDEVLTGCLKIIEKLAKDNGIELVLETPDSLSPLYADKRSVTQIVQNLLSNAIKFTGRGGMISVTARQSGTRSVIQIKDTGIGISSDILPTITEPFAQEISDPYRAQEGTGLGLSIVKSLTEAHGGDLDIQSKIGEGTTVTVSFPNEKAYTAIGPSNRPNQS